MQDIEEVARRMLTELREERSRIVETEQAVSAAEETVTRLGAALPQDLTERQGETGALLAELRGSIEDLRHNCVSSWAQTVRRWGRMLNDLQSRLARVESLAKLGELSASVAHEIRNPLCGMMLSVEVLRTKMDAGDSRMTLLQNLHRDAEKMEKVVQNLLHFARRYQPRLVPCEMEELVRKTADSISAHLRNKQIEVRIVRSSGETEAEVDPDLMQQVFRNVLLNSVDASPPESLIDVEIAVNQREDEAAVVFTDPGEGMDSDRLERIFDPFFTSKHNGVGLGLSVTRKIVDAHGGRIEVSSQPGQGTTFAILFPARAAQQTEKVAA